MIVTIERQSRTLRVLRVRSDPGILVREAPCLDRRASRMRQTSTGNLAINIRLQLQILGTRIAVWINRQGDVHLGDVDLYSHSSEAVDVGSNGRDTPLPLRDVPLIPHALP